MAEILSGAEILVDCLANHGVNVLFGYPGDTSVKFYDAMASKPGRIRYVLTRDERSAATMADVFARVSGRVGAVEASSGGGATYLIGGLGEAFAASVPVLVITSDIPRTSQGTGAITEIDQTKLFSAVTKWQATIRSASEIPALVAEALTAARQGRPGPVSLVFPQDVLEERALVSSEDIADRCGRPEIDDATLRQALEMLARSRQPAILAGSGIHLARAWGELTELSEKLGAPVATTIHGKGAIAEGHPLSLGVAGGNGARDYANEYLAEADVVILIGTRANSTDTNGYTTPPRHGTKIIHIDIDPEHVGKNYPGSIALVGDAQAVLRKLLTALTGVPPKRPEVRRWILDRRKAWQLAFQKEIASLPGRLDPREVVATIQRIVGPQTVILGEPGTPTPYLAAIWQSEEAGRQVVIPRGHGIMGFALAGSIGASFARPGQTVVAVTTDGSFGMAAGELETARRLSLPIVFIHLRNQTLGWIKMLQHLYAGKRYFGVDFSEVDATRVAEGFGVKAIAVANAREFEEALRTAMAASGPTLIDVPVPQECDVVPPVAGWLATLAGASVHPSY